MPEPGCRGPLHHGWPLLLAGRHPHGAGHARVQHGPHLHERRRHANGKNVWMVSISPGESLTLKIRPHEPHQSPMSREPQPRAGPCGRSVPLGVHGNSAARRAPGGQVRWQAGHRGRDRILLHRLGPPAPPCKRRAGQQHSHARDRIPLPRFDPLLATLTPATVRGHHPPKRCWSGARAAVQHSYNAPASVVISRGCQSCKRYCGCGFEHVHECAAGHTSACAALRHRLPAVQWASGRGSCCRR